MLSLRLLSPAAGGLVLFVTGLWLVKHSLGKLCRPFPTLAVSLMTESRPAGVLGGVVASFVDFSPTATLARLGDLSQARLLPLRRAGAVTLGLTTGSALFLQLLAFEPGALAAWAALAALVVYALFRRDSVRAGAAIILGAGVLFFGLQLVGNTVQELFALVPGQGIAAAMETLGHNPFHVFVAALALTALVQSPLITLALVMTLDFPTQAGFAAALGATVGASLAPLAAAFGARASYRRLAILNFLASLTAASLFMAILPRFTSLVMRISNTMGAASRERALANAYLFFAVLAAVILIPLLPAIEQIAISLGGRAGERARKALDADADSNPAKALETARGHVAAMGRSVLELLRKSLSAYLVDVAGMARQIRHARGELGTRTIVLQAVVHRIDEGALGEAERSRKMALSYVIKDIDRIAELVTDALAQPAVKMARSGRGFSMQQAHNFERFHRAVSDDLAEALDLVEGRPARPAKVLENDEHLNRLRRELSHFPMRQAAAEVEDDRQTSADFLDALAALRSIHFYVCDIVRLTDAQD